MSKESIIHDALNHFDVELPSWGFADTGTRFGKFLQPGAALSTEDKLEDAGLVNKLTGCCPSVAIHVLWDIPQLDEVPGVMEFAAKQGIRIGAVNPTLFQDQEYKYGSFGNSDPAIRKQAVDHSLFSVELMQKLGSRHLSLWFADGTNYPGQDDIVARKRLFEDGLKKTHDALKPGELMLVEYKPFEPAFYHTDLGDWGMSYAHCLKAGEQAKVLVDTGHHFQSQNIEQIVAFLLDEDRLGGFHFNDRRYADDDLTLASIDPYQIFRIFHEIHNHHHRTGQRPDLAYMIDQCHNVKPKIEAMIQTVTIAQELWAKAALVDRDLLGKQQKGHHDIDAEENLRRALFTDISGELASWRKAKGVSADPLKAYRESGYAEKIAKDRQVRKEAMGIGGGSFV